MDASRGSSRASRRTNDSLPVFNTPPPGMTKDSKAQHILGLSRSELHSARNQSLKPKFRFQSNIQDSNSIDKVSGSKSTVNGRASHLFEDRPGTAILDEAFGQETTVHRHPSNSTIRSFYDAVKAPLRISQQSSNSSSLDFILHNSSKISPILQADEMDTHHQSRFFRTSTPRNSGDGNKLRKKSSDGNFSSFSRRSSLSSKSPLITKVSVVSKPSTPTSRQSDRIRVVGLGGPGKPNNKTADDNLENPAFHTPYAKVHVRRPKAGTTHWFDDLEEISSDEEVVVDEIVVPEPEPEPELEPEPESEPEPYRVSEYMEPSFETAIVQCNRLSKDLARLVNAQEIPRRRANEILESVILTMEPGWKETEQANGDILHSRHSSVDTKSSTNPLEQADLKEESILNLSISDDEHEDDSEDDLPVSKSLRSSNSPSGIRESIAVDNYEVFDVEIGLAHTIKATGKRFANRPVPIRLISTKDIGRSLSPMSPSAFHSPEIESEVIDSGLFDAKDPEEDILISSFPATPVEPYMHRRSSIRSSNSLSDNPSVASMRTMKVTKQEENLIAAMRMKRAAMKRMERMAARKAALGTIQPTQLETIPSDRPSPRRRNPPPSSFRIDQSILPTRRSSLSYTVDEINKEDTRPGVISVTDSRILSGSETPLLSKFPGENPFRSGSSTPDHNSPIFDITRNIQQFSRQSPGPRPYAVSPSNKSGKNDSNIIVLDNLNSALPSPMLPSQLFIESPFLAWERNSDSAAVY